MRKSGFTAAQIIGMIKEQEAGLPISNLCGKHAPGPATFHKLKARYGGMDRSDARRPKPLEDGNAHLKRLLADAMLDIEPLSAIGPRTMARGAEGSAGKAPTTPMQRRDAVLRALRDRPISRRRAVDDMRRP